MIRQVLYTDNRSLGLNNTDGWQISKFTRLTADAGKAITDGVMATTCVDTTHPDLWNDCEAELLNTDLSAEQALAELVEVLT